MSIGVGGRGGCYCQWFKTGSRLWAGATDEGRRQQFRDQLKCGDP